MQLGFVSAILPELSLEDVLRLAAEQGYDCVELMCWPRGKVDRKFGGVTHIDTSDFTASAADDVGALCQQFGVGISGLGYYPNILSGDEEESRVAIEHLKSVIRAARMLELKNVNTFIGNDHRQGVRYNLVRFREVWPDLVRYGEDHDVRIGIENCPMLFSDDEWPGGKNLARSPAIWRQMFDFIPSNHFGLNFDPSHFVLQMMDYIEPVYEFRHKLFHIHAKDMKIQRRRLNDHGIMALGWSTPKIPGLGEVDWNRFVSALSDVGYQGAVCVEVEDESFTDTLEGRKKSLCISRNVLRPLLG